MNAGTRYSLGVLSALLLSAQAALAQSAGAGSTTVSWLKISVGGRGAAMGDSISAVSKDVSAIFWNPALLVNVDKPQLMGQYGSWFAETGYHAAAFAMPVKNQFGQPRGVLGMGISLFDSGEIRRTVDLNDAIKLDSQLDSEDWFRANGMQVMASYGTRFGDSFGMGYSIKLVGEGMTEKSVLAVAADLGACFELDVGAKMNVSVLIQNLGTRIQSMSLPTNLKLGAGVELGNLILTSDINAPVDHSIEVGAGCEYSLTHLIKLRAGWLLSKNESGLNMPGVTTGMGLDAGDMCIDIAVVPYGELGTTTRTSMMIKF